MSCYRLCLLLLLIEHMFCNTMDEPDKRDCSHTSVLEDTVRNLREENAKLMQLLRSQGLLLDSSLNTSSKASESIPSSVPDTPSITFDHSDLSLTTNSTTTTNQISQQHIHNHAPANQQNHNEQTIHGSQSNITPNFNTVIQSTGQPFVQNNSNTLVQNNTNLIQPINLVNFNNVSLDSIQSFFASQNNVMYLSQTSASASSSTTTTTTTTTTTSSSTSAMSILTNCTSHEPTSTSEQQSSSPTSKLLVNRQHQELVPVIQKIGTEQYEHLRRQSRMSFAAGAARSLKKKSGLRGPRPIRPKLSSRIQPLRIYIPAATKASLSSSNAFRSSSPASNVHAASATVSLLSSPTSSSSPPTSSYVSQSSSVENHFDHSPDMQPSTSLELPVYTPSKILAPSDTTNTRPTRQRKRTLKNTPGIVRATSRFGRPLARTSSKDLYSPTSNNPITKRPTTTRKPTKRNIRGLAPSQTQSILPADPSSPSTVFAQSISGLLENLDQELMASNFLAHATTNNLLAEVVDGDIQHLVHGAIQREESYHATITSMPTLEEFNDRLDGETHIFHAEHEQITSFMSEEDMRLVEMTFDENTFLRQFDLEDAGIRLSVHSDQNLFANILTDGNTTANDLSTAPPVSSSVFTTVVPLGLQQQTSQNEPLAPTNQIAELLPQEGVQLTARHIQPSQVATYESANYQDILDDLVMVTDQDALQHAQAAAADDPSIVTADFPFTLLETTPDAPQASAAQVTEQPTELPEIYSTEQQQQEPPQVQTEVLPSHQPIVVLEKLQSDVLASTTISKDLLETSILNTSSVDLVTVLQLEATQSSDPSSTVTSTTESSQPIDFDALLPPLNVTTSDTSACAAAAAEEMIIDSGHLDQLTSDLSTLSTREDVVEDLLRDTDATESYEIVENQGQAIVENPVIVDNIERLIEQIEPRRADSQLLERTFSRYQQKYQSNLQHEYDLQSRELDDESADLLSVKINPDDIDEPRSPSPSPAQQSPLRVTTHAKSPSSASFDEGTRNRAIQKAKNKKSHHRHSQRRKAMTEDMDLDCNSFTRYERPSTRLYDQPSPPTSNEVQQKNEDHSPSSSQNDPSTVTPTLHSGFIIDEQTPPASIISAEHRQSPPPLLLSTQSKGDQLKGDYSDLVTYNNTHDLQSNNSFITPPPEIDLHPFRHKSRSFDNLSPFSGSPRKGKHRRRHQPRESRATSSTSSKSTSNTDYALDTEALEPVSPTPLEATGKPKHTSSNTTDDRDASPSYYEQQQHRPTKDYHSRKSSSSTSNRSSRPTPSSSQFYQQSRSISHHNYRSTHEPTIHPPPSMHLDPYAPSYPHFHPRVGSIPPPFFNYPYAHPTLHSHSTAPAPRYHHPSTKYPSSHHYPSHGYPMHQQNHSYHSHLPRQQSYHHANYTSSRDHRSFDR